MLPLLLVPQFCLVILPMLFAETLAGSCLSSKQSPERPRGTGGGTRRSTTTTAQEWQQPQQSGNSLRVPSRSGSMTRMNSAPPTAGLSTSTLSRTYSNEDIDAIQYMKKTNQPDFVANHRQAKVKPIPYTPEYIQRQIDKQKRINAAANNHQQLARRQQHQHQGGTSRNGGRVGGRGKALERAGSRRATSVPDNNNRPLGQSGRHGEVAHSMDKLWQDFEEGNGAAAAQQNANNLPPEQIAQMWRAYGARPVLGETHMDQMWEQFNDKELSAAGSVQRGVERRQNAGAYGRGKPMKRHSTAAATTAQKRTTIVAVDQNGRRQQTAVFSSSSFADRRQNQRKKANGSVATTSGGGGARKSFSGENRTPRKFVVKK